MLQARDTAEVTGRDRLLVFFLAFAWGGNWIGGAIALHEASPWTLRFFGSSFAVLTLIAASLMTGRTLKVPRGQRVHVMVAGFLNVALFQILSGFAQANGATSRVVILNYSMPIWTTIMSCVLLGERLDRTRGIAIVLCAVGLGVLVWPLVEQGVPATAFLALGCAWAWGGATVYLKWVKSTVPPLATATWQLVFGLMFIAAGTFVFEGAPRFNLSFETWAAILFVGVIGTGFAHFLWWSIAGRLSPITASIGSLLVPVIGVLGSVALLGERPSLNDIVGFVLILGSAACVLLVPTLRGARA